MTFAAILRQECGWFNGSGNAPFSSYFSGDVANVQNVCRYLNFYSIYLIPCENNCNIPQLLGYWLPTWHNFAINNISSSRCYYCIFHLPETVNRLLDSSNYDSCYFFNGRKVSVAYAAREVALFCVSQK